VIRGPAALMVAVLATALPAAGQPRPEGGEKRPGARERRGPREEAFRMIDAYIVSNLQESLDLTDEQFVALLPLVKRLQSDRRGFVQRRQQSLMELRRLLASGGATEPRVTELLRQVKAVEVEEPSILRRDRDAIDGALTPVQQAKFRVLELEVEHKIRELMNQIRAERRGRANPRTPGERPPGP
jgi:Spy/CpxP family protein refolding chaperone